MSKMSKIYFDSNLSIILINIRIKDQYNQKTPYVLAALDTGASVTTISWDVLEKLNYSPGSTTKKERIITASGVEYVPIVKITQLWCGGSSVHNLDVYAHNFPEESYVEAAIGINCLKQFNKLNINFTQGIIKLG